MDLSLNPWNTQETWALQCTCHPRDSTGRGGSAGGSFPEAQVVHSSEEQGNPNVKD